MLHLVANRYRPTVTSNYLFPYFNNVDLQVSRLVKIIFVMDSSYRTTSVFSGAQWDRMRMKERRRTVRKDKGRKQSCPEEGRRGRQRKRRV